MRRNAIELAVLSDVHFPHQDDIALQCAMDVIKHEKPSKIYLNGDILDMYQLSHWDRNPARVETLQEEIDLGIDFLAKLRAMCPHSDIVYILGNHEDRLRRFLWQNPALHSLRCLEFDDLLKLDNFGIRSIPYRKFDVYRNLKIKHGKRCGVNAPRQNLNDEKMSGVSGHTHRLNYMSNTAGAGRFFWAESGCLCDLDPEFVNGVADWQHGMLLGGNLNGDLQIKLVHISEGDAFY